MKANILVEYEASQEVHLTPDGGQGSPGHGPFPVTQQQVQFTSSALCRMVLACVEFSTFDLGERKPSAHAVAGLGLGTSCTFVQLAAA